jgi:23S rRNA (uridine2552-2'-O)-methyltransferase
LSKLKFNFSRNIGFAIRENESRNPQRKKMKPSVSKKNKSWQDHYTLRAKKERYPARSVYKLQEIQQKHSLIKKGHKILDLGCSPGSWLIYAARLTTDKGRVIGIDLKPVKIQVPSQVKIITADVFSLDVESLGKDFNVVLSDMAPDTTGHKAVDAARSFNLCETALSIAQKVLLPGGHFICKIFQGHDFKQFQETVKTAFHEQKIFKPRSSRKASKEIYILGIDFKGNSSPIE